MSWDHENVIKNISNQIQLRKYSRLTLVSSVSADDITGKMMQNNY